jgi:hypothetical protein
MKFNYNNLYCKFSLRNQKWEISCAQIAKPSKPVFKIKGSKFKQKKDKSREGKDNFKKKKLKIKEKYNRRER